MDRRFFLQGIAGSTALVWLRGLDPVRIPVAQATPSSTGYRILNKSQAATLEAMAAQIIPTDDTPGAREARVVNFIDNGLATFAANQRQVIERGLAAFDAEVRSRFPDGGGFAGLQGATQIELMMSLEQRDPGFFESVRVATLAGMFADPKYGGNFEKVGWKLIGFDDRFGWAPPFGDYDR
jgi:gluconate 2-dehydrogenase gamma chain